MFDKIVKVLSYASVFYMGRLSYLYWRNAFLDQKKQELLEYSKELDRITHELITKEASIRKKWQYMVDDISKYQAAVNPEDTGKWTEMDDIYLKSWNSAEK